MNPVKWSVYWKLTPVIDGIAQRHSETIHHTAAASIKRAGTIINYLQKAWRQASISVLIEDKELSLYSEDGKDRKGAMAVYLSDGRLVKADVEKKGGVSVLEGEPLDDSFRRAIGEK